MDLAPDWTCPRGNARHISFIPAKWGWHWFDLAETQIICSIWGLSALDLNLIYLDNIILALDVFLFKSVDAMVIQEPRRSCIGVHTNHLGELCISIAMQSVIFCAKITKEVHQAKAVLSIMGSGWLNLSGNLPSTPQVCYKTKYSLFTLWFCKVINASATVLYTTWSKGGPCDKALFGKDICGVA